MDEKEVNKKVVLYLHKNNHKNYQGITTRGRDVPAMDGSGSVNLDFYCPCGNGLWIESKGDVSATEVIGAVAKVCFAVHYSTGKGLVAAPSNLIDWLLEHKDFLVPMVRMFPEGTIGLFDAEKETVIWL